MKCKFERKTIYDNQVFLAGQTYELSKRDAEALGFAKASRVAAEEASGSDKNKKEK